jgi:hypothetical protein
MRSPQPQDLRSTPTQLLANFLYTACAICYNANRWNLADDLKYLDGWQRSTLPTDQNTEEDLFYDA